VNSLSPALWGAILGLSIGILLVLIPVSKVLLIVLLVVVGYWLGKLMESEELRNRLRRFFSLLFR
jgi:chromate transport protein ChrA